MSTAFFSTNQRISKEGKNRQPGDGVNIDHHTIKGKKKMTDRRHNFVFFSPRIFFLKKKKPKRELLGTNCFHISNNSNEK
jgi:hypothetical protein